MILEKGNKSNLQVIVDYIFVSAVKKYLYFIIKDWSDIFSRRNKFIKFKLIRNLFIIMFPYSSLDF